MATKLVRVEARDTTYWVNPQAIWTIWIGDDGRLHVNIGGGAIEPKEKDFEKFCKYLRTDPGVVISDG